MSKLPILPPLALIVPLKVPLVAFISPVMLTPPEPIVEVTPLASVNSIDAGF